jgi:putative transposase
MTDAFQAEIRFLGMESSPAFVREPEGNGCAEWFIRTLKGNLLWVHPVRTIEELRLALLEFKDLYNTHWLIERHGNKTPAQVREEQLTSMQEAARNCLTGSLTLVNRCRLEIHYPRESGQTR